MSGQAGLEQATGSDLQKMSSKTNRVIKTKKAKTCLHEEHMSFSVSSFSHEIRNIASGVSDKGHKWEVGAFQAFAEGSQQFLIDMFADLQASAANAGRHTILKQDMNLVKQISHTLHLVKTAKVTNSDPHMQLCTRPVPDQKNMPT